MPVTFKFLLIIALLVYNFFKASEGSRPYGPHSHEALGLALQFLYQRDTLITSVPEIWILALNSNFSQFFIKNIS